MTDTINFINNKPVMARHRYVKRRKGTDCVSFEIITRSPVIRVRSTDEILTAKPSTKTSTKYEIVADAIRILHGSVNIRMQKNTHSGMEILMTISYSQMIGRFNAIRKKQRLRG
ncbi:MAG: hypothetical protein SPE99_01470 [Blautia sp.]|nr:hypothetical protein [Blautia sp.]